MAYDAKIIKDTLAPSGFRLTTMQLTYPRFVHAEFMTHRMFSRNAASSRAIPIHKMIEQAQKDPVIPVWWGKAQPGMQAKEEISIYQKQWCRETWLQALYRAIETVQLLDDRGLHKQIPNRLLEPWSWITVIVTGNSLAYENFFALRCHPDAQPELNKIAVMARDLYFSHDPEHAEKGFWHLPYVNKDTELLVGAYAMEHDLSPSATLCHVSVARCARVSYLTHEGKIDITADLKLTKRLMDSGHWSPFEHVARAHDQPIISGNFVGFDQYRKFFDGECRTYSFPDVNFTS